MVYNLPLGNFSLDSVTQTSASITVNGYCLPCEVGPNDQSKSSFNYTLEIYQVVDTSCATESKLELIALSSKYKVALFKESETSSVVCV